MGIYNDLNDPINQLPVVDNFLYNYGLAQHSMKKATEALLRVAQLDGSTDKRRHYERVHKRMVRLTREWNRVEHQREPTQGE